VTRAGAFDTLSPEVIFESVEAAYGIRSEGGLWPYSSYVNRVYGFRGEDEKEYVVKFYRPGRWTDESILEEHQFLTDCAEAELPVVAPLPDLDGGSLPSFSLDEDDGCEDAGAAFSFALFPKRGGRNFDAETDDDWLRLGALAGRLHAVGAKRGAKARLTLGPELALANLGIVEPLVHPEFRAEFAELCRETIALTADQVSSLSARRIHGDLHRGNILSRPGEGLLLLDFDDMMVGPPVQDLWLLLPGRADDASRERSLLLEGYSEFAELESGSVRVIETLRFYRMLHFLAWRSLQRDDQWFKRDYPDWGGRAFWIGELEDFRDQSRAIRDDL
jgi:Ser/Thr protein kinase RdoA (MazF antagonist)